MPGSASWRVTIGGEQMEGLVQTFGESPPGSLVALLHSDGYLGISVVKGNAAARLNVVTGERVTLGQ